MCAMIVGTITVVLSGIIALLALSIGGYTTMLRIFSYVPFFPAKFYFNAMKAIEKLEELDKERKGSSGEKYKCGIVEKDDTGFSELVEIFKGKAMLRGEVKEVQLVEEGAAMTSGSSLWDAQSHTVVRFLILVRSNGEKESQPYNSSDPAQATRDLKYWVDEITRKSVGRWLVVIIFLYMAAGIYLALAT